MQIGLISDTHIPDIVEAIPQQVLEAFKDVDLILHAGDIATVSALDELANIAPVLAARGDDDYQLQDKRIQDVQNLNIEGCNIYVIHASQYWAHSIVKHPEDHDLEKAPDVVVFGHTHREWLENIGDHLLVNPGSATFPYYQLRLGSVGILSINDSKAEARIIQLGDT